MRAGLGARTSSELLRESICTKAAPVPPPGTPVTVPAPGAPALSVMRCTSGAMSAATAYFRLITSTSPEAGVSIAAMILPMRCRLSA